MTTKSNPNFLTGLITGIVITLALAFSIKMIKASASRAEKPGVLAEIDDHQLTRTDLSKKLAGDLVPVENEEYRVLSTGIDSWLEPQLMEKEAAAQKTDTKTLYAKEIWSQVPAVPEPQRQENYERVKESYLAKLKEKYHAKVYLKKPASYVKNLAVSNSANLPEAPVPQAAAGVLPPASAVFSDLTGLPSQGPENAPVTLVEFSDFHCPFCKKAEPTVDQLMKNYAGKIRRVWRHYPLPFHEGAHHTHEASECAHEQGKFWEFHEKIFAAESSPNNDAALIQIAEQSGIEKNKFQACLTSGKYKDLIDREIARGQVYGVQGTPAFFLNGRLMIGAQPYQNFSNMVESLLDPSKAAKLLAPPPPSPQPKQPSPPPAAANTNFTDLKGRPSEGPENAPVTLVEFSDFFCPFCKRIEPTIDQIMANYKGKVRKVWRHYPLSFHLGSDRVHEASECAHEQGKFWDYHKKLFETRGQPKDDAALIQLAAGVGLNKKKFEGCLTSGKYKALIQQEIARGAEAGVNGTPAVFINGQLISGAQPYASFEAVIKSKLSQKGS